MAESKPYRLHPEAWLEIAGADDWYLLRSVDASAGFIAAISEALESISQAPGAGPSICTEPGGLCFTAIRFPSFTWMIPTR